MKIKVGKKYKTRDGRVVEINDDKGSHLFPFVGTVEGEPFKRVWSNGGVYTQGCPTELDLVEEIVEEKKFKLQVGKRYKTRDGRETTTIEPFGDPMFPFCGSVGGNFKTWTEDGFWMEGGGTVSDLVEEIAEPIKLQAGKKYRTRDGRIAKIEAEVRDGKYPFSGVIEGQNLLYHYWSKEGFHHIGKVSQEDLIEEIVEPKPEPTKPIRVLTCLVSLKDQKTVLLRDSKGDEYTYTRAVEPEYKDGDLVLTHSGHLCIVEGKKGSLILRDKFSFTSFRGIDEVKTKVKSRPIQSSDIGKTVYYRERPMVLVSIHNPIRSCLNDIAVVTDEKNDRVFSATSDFCFVEPV